MDKLIGIINSQDNISIIEYRFLWFTNFRALIAQQLQNSQLNADKTASMFSHIGRRCPNTIPIKRVKHFQLFNVLITAEHCCDPVEGWITGIPDNFFFSILGFRLKRSTSLSLCRPVKYLIRKLINKTKIVASDVDISLLLGSGNVLYQTEVSLKQKIPLSQPL